MPLHAADERPGKKSGGKGPGRKSGGNGPGGGKPGLAARSSKGGSSVPRSSAGRRRPKGWPKWPFPPEGPTLDIARKLGEKLAASGEFELAATYWERLDTIFLAAYGENDGRVWAAVARESRCLLELGRPVPALWGSSRTLKSMQGAFLPHAVDAGLEAGMAIAHQIAKEVAFSLQTQLEAEGPARKALKSGNAKAAFFGAFGATGDDAPDLPGSAGVDALMRLLSQGGKAPGRGAAGPGTKGGAVGWDVPEGEGVLTERLAALRGELERTEARSGSTGPEAAEARYRYAMALAGEWGPDTGYEVPDVPGANLAEALRLCDGLPEALADAAGRPSRLDALRLQGYVAFRSGDNRLAEEARRKALHEAEAKFEPWHPRAITAAAELAFTLIEKGDVQGAFALISRSAEAKDKTDATDEELARMTVVVSSVNLLAGDVAGAIAMRFGAAGALERRYGKDYRGAVELRARGARLLFETEDFRAAAGLLGACAESAARAAGPGDLRALHLADEQAAALLMSGDPSAAEKVVRATLSVRRGRGGPKGSEADAGLADTLTLLGGIRQYLGDRAGARAANAEERAARARAKGPGHRETIATLTRAADAAEASGDADGALELRREALGLREESLGPDDPDTIESRKAVERLSAKAGGKGDRKPGAGGGGRHGARGGGSGKE
ncbi:MAG: hypothetical protein LBR80_00775 [Deltaproteobacteria bacterium]|jgi:hypothetical protein|nr:hypothetical protein [Deltaproteobacteria bacterium]